MLLPEAFGVSGRAPQRDRPPRRKTLTVDGRLLGLARHPTEKTMLVNDADALLWVGQGAIW